MFWNATLVMVLNVVPWQTEVVGGEKAREGDTDDVRIILYIFGRLCEPQATNSKRFDYA